MLIGIDASRAARGKRTGTEKYSFQLIRHLVALDQKNRYRLYFDRPPFYELRIANCELRVMPFPRLWTHVRLSWEMMRRPPDVLFVPAHVLPIVHPPRSVVTIHDLGYLYFPRTYRALDRLYLDLTTRYNARAAAHIIADSQATKRDLVERYGVEPSKISVIYPGYDEEAFQPVREREAIEAVKARYGIAGDYILFVGTIQPRKNLVRLMEAFSLLKRQAADLQLVIAGKKGWLYEAIFRRVEELGLEGQVVFTGYVAEEGLPALFSGARLFVFPSLYEGFGLPVLEAMACGTPVVCSNASSLPEVAGDAAVLVNPRDVEELAGAMRQLVESQEIRAELRGKGLAQAARFSWQRAARETLIAYLAVLGQS